MMNMTDTRDLDDDTLLSAYLDGELPADDADRLTDRIAREPQLAERLAALRATDASTRDAFAALDTTPMPQAVLDLLEADTLGSAGNVVAFPARGVRRFLQVPVALAASVALFAGFLGSELLRQAPDAGPGLDALFAGTVAPDSGVYRLLESGSSAVPQAVAADATGLVVMTFEDRAGDYCRQFEVTAGARAAHGVACRRDTRWQMEALSFAAVTAGSGTYQQASATTAAVLTAAVDKLIGAREPLDAEEETSILSNSWKKPAE